MGSRLTSYVCNLQKIKVIPGVESLPIQLFNPIIHQKFTV